MSEAHTTVPRASLADTLGVAAEVLIPLVARGVIARRPAVVAGPPCARAATSCC